MSDKKPKYDKFVTPRGIAVFPRLNTPDTKFNPDGDWTTKLRIALSSEAPGRFTPGGGKVEQVTVQDIMQRIEEAAQASYDSTVADLKANGKAAAAKAVKKADLPFRMAVDEDGNETGEVEFSFKQKAIVKKKDGTASKITPELVDAKGKPFPRSKSIWGGSTLKVDATIVPYYVAGTKQAGVALRLNGAQVLDLVTGTGQKCGFEEEEGYEASEDDAETTESTEDTTSDDDGSEDF